MKYCLAALGEIDAMLRGAERVLIATDFDGTLCPIADSPAEVWVASATLEVLRRAAANPCLTLAVISGRGLEDVRRRLPLDIVFAGNHGLEISGGGLEFEHEEARQLRPAVAGACEALQQGMQKWSSAWVEDKGLSATLHFRKVDRRQHPALLFTARQCLRPFGAQLALRAGNRALEIRPRVAWDKGSALRFIQQTSGPFDLCVSLGDDRTDETMFRANGGALNIRVGAEKPSAATHYLRDTAEVAILLSHVVDMCGARAFPRSSSRAPVCAAAGD